MPNHNRNFAGRFDLPLSVSAERIVLHSKAIQDVAVRMSDHALSTARIIIGAEELLRQRVRSALRVAVATVFFAISGLISLGANVTAALAKKVNPHRASHALTTHKRAGKNHSASVRYLHHVKLRKSHVRSYAHHSDAARNSTRGVASWYGNEFHNRQTASGSRFDTHAMTAAHRSLPFGTKVRVTNTANAKSCIVEITDRGPFAKGRLIDLSYAAAEEIGMAQTGVANVEIEVLGSRLAQQKTFEDLASLQKGSVLDQIPRATPRPLASSLLNSQIAAYDNAVR
jgi:rare lipoprotein A